MRRGRTRSDKEAMEALDSRRPCLVLDAPAGAVVAANDAFHALFNGHDSRQAKDWETLFRRAAHRKAERSRVTFSAASLDEKVEMARAALMASPHQTFVRFDDGGRAHVVTQTPLSNGHVLLERSVRMDRTILPELDPSIRGFRALACHPAADRYFSNDVLSIGLEEFSRSLALIRPTGELLAINEKFRTLLIARDILALDGNHLVFADRALESGILQGMLDLSSKTRGSEVFRIATDPAAFMRCDVVVSEAHPNDPVLLVRGPDPAGADEIPEPVLQYLFGVTPKEARTLNVLKMGMTRREMATFLGIGEETLKSRLNTVRGKLGVDRVIDIVPLLTKLERVL